jgi:hypothetical protein
MKDAGRVLVHQSTAGPDSCVSNGGPNVQAVRAFAIRQTCGKEVRAASMLGSHRYRAHERGNRKPQPSDSSAGGDTTIRAMLLPISRNSLPVPEPHHRDRGVDSRNGDSRFGGPRVRVEGRDPGRRGQDRYEPFALYSSFFVDRMPGRATTCSTGVHLLYDS